MCDSPEESSEKSPKNKEIWDSKDENLKEETDKEETEQEEGASRSIRLCSPNLDPLEALYSNNVEIPVPNAPVFDNLSILISKMKNLRKPEVTNRDKLEDIKKKAAEQSEKRGAELVTVKRKTFAVKNVLTIMEELHEGPLASLARCTKERLRIKVITRSHSGIRGHCVGYLKAFDKMWNLAMTDVIEVWTRRRKKKIPAGIDGNLVANEDINLNVKIPEVKVRIVKKGVEECTRHVPQFLMRGEHVVTINILS